MKTVLLRKFWVPQSFEPVVTNHRGLKGWFSTDEYYINEIDNVRFALFVRDTTKIKSALSQDAFRLGLNALQTLQGIRSNASFPKLTAWHLIQAYYASFFAAHSILRLFGKPLISLETGHLRHISKRAETELGIQCIIKAGFFSSSFDTNKKVISFAPKKHSHKDMWKEFATLLNKLSTEVLTARGISPELAQASEFLSEIHDLLNRNTESEYGSWLSSFRNEINYHSLEPAWYPFTKNETESRSFFSSLKSWHKGEFTPRKCTSKKTDIEVFFGACLLVCQLCTSILRDYCELADKKNSRILMFKKFSELSKNDFEI